MTEPLEAALLSCPFCGSTPTVWTDVNCRPCEAFCLACGCRARIEVWNRRAQAVADAYRRGQEEMRERAAWWASQACLVPPDGGSATPEEKAVADAAAAAIRALPVKEPTTKEPT